MDSNPFADPVRTTVQSNKHPSTIPPTGAFAPEQPSMFSNAQNTNITSSLFSITVHGPSPLDVLRARAAPNAILNAGGRADKVRCHPGTRKEVLRRIEKWRDTQGSLTPPIFWLSGPAGAGKSAIMQTMAERCRAQGIPHANFFFFRPDDSRNSLSPLVATLVHQIILLYPSLQVLVATALTINPLILDTILEDQLRQLVVTPLQAVQQSSRSYVIPVLLIDGLDECESEGRRNPTQILHTFDKILVDHPRLFRLLVASRDESQIRAAFSNLTSHLLPLYLDNQYSPENDIRAFVNDEFQRARQTHPLAFTLDAGWPSIDDVEEIVKKSSGQFIYAATVMHFILDSSTSPMLSLARIQGVAQISTKSPFSHLDGIYTYILSRVEDQIALKVILHAHFLIRDASQTEYAKRRSLTVDLMMLLEAHIRPYSEVEVLSCMADLTPLALYTPNQCIGPCTLAGQLVFHHGSFPDYLLDESRSGDYFVDLDTFTFKIQSAIWNALVKWPWRNLDIIAYTGLCRLRQLPPGLLDAVDPSRFFHFDIEVIDFLERVYHLCACDANVTKYKWIVRQWVYSLKDIPLLQETHANGGRWPPCGYRYVVMARLERDVSKGLHDHIEVALRPQTDSDAHETALWLHNLLNCIHREKYRRNVKEYNRLLQKWLSWAASNDIPLDGVDHLPNAWWYIKRSRIEKWLATRLGIATRTK